MTRNTLFKKVNSAIINLGHSLTEVMPKYPGLTISIRAGEVIICGDSTASIEALDSWPSRWEKPRPRLMTLHRAIGRGILSVISPIIASAIRSTRKSIIYLRIIIDSETDAVYIDQSQPISSPKR